MTNANPEAPHGHGADRYLGAPILRLEDERLITGKGCYVDDINPPDALHLTIVRSPYPKASIVSIDTSSAQAMPGVVAILTADDLDERLSRVPQSQIPGMQMAPNPVLAKLAVPAVGVGVVAVLARSAAIGADAASSIYIEYEPLPSIANAEAALEPDAPQVWDHIPGNLCATVVRENGDVEQAFAQADHVVRHHIYSPRLVANAMEPRGIVAAMDAQGLTVWVSTQSPHRVRAEIAGALGMPESKVHVIAPDVGGGFGSKGPVYREYLLAAYLAVKFKKPVKWIATRSEEFATAIQGRDQSIHSEMAVRRDGTILGLKVQFVTNAGYTALGGPPLRTLGLVPGCYRIPNIRLEMRTAYTNTPPTGPYRGAGRPEAVQNIERLMDQAANDLGMDRLELRRKNFLQPDEFPYRNGVGGEYDSGDFEKALAEALHLSDYESLIKHRDEAQKRGELVGVGISTFVEPSGGPGIESGMVRVEPSGAVTVYSGSSDHGQGHETTFGQIVASSLHVLLEQVSVRHGDTVAVAQGGGTFSSRSLVLGGNALVVASERILVKARAIAAHLAEASPEEMTLTDDGFVVAGAPTQKIGWQQVAATAYAPARLPAGMEPGLQELAFFDPRKETWGFGAHIAMVSIDRETGTPTIEKLVLVDDCGVLINPLLVEGQIHGGLAQGLAESLREHEIFDDDGQMLAGSFLDYAVPRAQDIPEVILGETVTPSPLNPLGAKGVGEAATNGLPPAIANAVRDALSPLGVQQLDMPYTAPKLWKAIREAERTA